MKDPSAPGKVSMTLSVLLNKIGILEIFYKFV